MGESPLKDLKYQVYLLKGEAGAGIPELARERKIDAIVMGTVYRTGIEGFLIGNTAGKILSRVDRPVLAIKPGGFRMSAKLD